MAKILLYINDTSGSTGLSQNLGMANGNKAGYVNDLQNYLGKVFQNPSNSALQVSTASVAKASGTLTLSGVVATDTCAVISVTFTAVASGATGNQFNVGADDTETAVNLKNAINANATLSQMVVATSALGVVTITAVDYGTSGNAYALTAGTHFTRSAATLTGGVSPSYSLLTGATFT